MRPLYNDEVIELERFLDVVLHPENYGCRIEITDPLAFVRAQAIIETAARTIESLRGRNFVRNLYGGSEPAP